MVEVNYFLYNKQADTKPGEGIFIFSSHPVKLFKNPGQIGKNHRVGNGFHQDAVRFGRGL